MSRVLRGNAAAIEFCLLLGSVSQTWDDLIDGDKPVTAQQINAAFFKALIQIPANRFYRIHFASLQPLMQAAAYDWLAANELERGGADEQALAYVLRDSLVAVVTQCAALVGGHGWAIDHAAAIRRYFHDEPAAEYVRKLKEHRS
ncbi:MAG: hypothetical protein ACREVL_06580 [Solimonas sp.]